MVFAFEDEAWEDFIREELQLGGVSEEVCFVDEKRSDELEPIRAGGGCLQEIRDPGFWVGGAFFAEDFEDLWARYFGAQTDAVGESGGELICRIHAIAGSRRGIDRGGFIGDQET